VLGLVLTSRHAQVSMNLSCSSDWLKRRRDGAHLAHAAGDVARALGPVAGELAL
jgi:hypothetical protein